MRTSLRASLAVLAVAIASGQAPAQPPEGSQLPPEENNCATCHGEEALWEAETLRLYVPKESLADDVHFNSGVNCHDCHGGDPATFDPGAAHPTDIEPGESKILPFRTLAEARQACANCHKEQWNGLRIGDAHNTAGQTGEQDGAGPLDCTTCHGVLEEGQTTDQVHGMRPVDDPKSPAFLDHQVQICGRCHEPFLQTYQKSVHGVGLSQSGLLVTAVCADCHGAHAMYYKNDVRNPLHPTNVAETCGQCHRFIQERVQASVHGRDDPADGPADRPRSGGKQRRKPSCTDCHQRHDLADPESTIFRIRLPNRCGNCHAELSEYYAMSIHGELTALGYGPGAKCSDCHGAHDILPVSDPRSRLFHDRAQPLAQSNQPLAQSNRRRTCGTCHPFATANFLDFDPHADHTDPARDPVLHWVYVGLLTLLFSVFGFFGVHSALWSVRSLIHVFRVGRPKNLSPGSIAYLRFGAFHRVAHTLMLVSFLGLALTGLPLKYSHYGWAQTLAYSLGGFDSTRVWHRIFGAASFVFLAVYLARMVVHVVQLRRRGATWRTSIFGPDSPVPNFRDVKDFFKMLRWFFGLGPKPTFERWTYWEKFDFWGACADIVIIGSTGLVLWFPNLFCLVLPGKALNIAKVIHSTQALLATGFVFAIHFFNTPFRPEKFPMDLSVLTGLVSEEELREERPEYLARLREKRLRQIEAAGLQEANLEYIERTRQQGKLDEIRAAVPSRKGLWLIMLGGLLALLVGLGLLLGMILAALSR